MPILCPTTGGDAGRREGILTSLVDKSIYRRKITGIRIMVGFGYYGCFRLFGKLMVAIG